MRRSTLAVLLGCACVVSVGAQAAIRHIPGPEKRPYSAATTAGEFIYVTGNGGEGEDIGAQTSSSLDRIAATLKKAGADLGDVVETQVHLTRAADAAGMERAYGARFGKNPPARTLIVTPALVGGLGLVEINAIAVRHGMAHHAVLPQGWKQPTAAFSYGQKIGNTLFISGLTAHSPVDGSAAADNIGAQTRAVMDSVGAVLKVGGMDYGDLTAGRVWIGDIEKNFANMNAVYRAYFVGGFPARATLQFGMIDPADLVEIAAVAVKGSRRVIPAAISADGQSEKPNPNYSAGVAVGNRMWITGMVGQTRDNAGDTSSQTRETLARMLRVLKAGGFKENQVVEVYCYLRDAKDTKQFEQMNDGYRQVFQKDLPARTTVQAANAGKAAVEIVMTAAR